MNGRAAALGISNHRYDLRQHSVEANAFGLHDETASPIQGCPRYLVARVLFNRHGFASQHGLIDSAVAFKNNAIDRDFLAGTYTQGIARLYLANWHINFRAVRTNKSRHFGSEIEQGP